MITFGAMDIASRLEQFRTLETKPRIEPKKVTPIYTADLETDPFAHNQMIAPFAAGFYDGQDFSLYWGQDCVKRFFAYLETKEPGLVYIHNFGGFDFFWMLPYFTGQTLIRNGRIICTTCKAKGGKYHELRDSYAIMPFALKEYHDSSGKKVKLDIDMWKLKKKNREKYKTQIVRYLKRDCTGLHELVMRFIDRFGDKITIGSTAMSELQAIHDYIKMEDAKEDHEIRSQFYYGGRVQCFDAGNLKGNWKVYDVNSMYPYVMKTYRHPICRLTSVTQKITKDTAFIVTEGQNFNAFPVRDHDGSLRFDEPYGIFSVTIHEWNVALKYGLFKPKRVLYAYNFKLQRSFDTFVDRFYSLRKKAKEENDSAMSLFYKYVLNSSYGKFAQDGSDYFDYQITPETEDLRTKEPCGQCAIGECAEHWMIDTLYPEFKLILWKRGNPKPAFYNVATGCSITGAARSVLLEAYANSKRPIYCDTDSLICESLKNVTFHKSELGAWDLEAQGDLACIAGKKMYALFNGREVVKQANKGCRITAAQIKYLAGDPAREIEYERESPSLSIHGEYSFLSRTVRRTA